MGYVSAIKPFSALLAEKKNAQPKVVTKSIQTHNAITHAKLNGHKILRKWLRGLLEV